MLLDLFLSNCSVVKHKCTNSVRFQGQINLPAKTLLHKLYNGIDEMPRWNPTVLEAKILKVNIDSNVILDCSRKIYFNLDKIHIMKGISF